MSILTYKYNDTPEGEDCFQKMFYLTKHAALLSKLVNTLLPTLIPTITD